MKTTALFSLLIISAVIPAVSLESVSINGSNYYWAGVNDSNGNPWVLINRSSGNAQWSTAETEDINDALSRQSWLKYSFSFGRLAANNTILGVLVPGMDSFNTYGFNDSQGWRTEANKSVTLGGGQPVTMRLKHERSEGGQYVNMTVRYEMGNRAYNTLTDIYFFLKIQNITHFDKLNVYKDNYIYDVPIFGSRNFSNVSMVTLHGNQSPPSWTYVFDDSERNIVFVKDGSVWLGYPLGRSLPAYSSFQRSFQSIDAVCGVACVDPDDLLITTTEDDLDAGQIIDSASNHTTRTRWTDLLGTCTISASCRITIGIRNPYGTASSCVGVTDGEPSAFNTPWMVCTKAGSSQCPTTSGVRSAWTPTQPTKSTWYYFNMTVQGRYSSMTNASHKMVGQMGVGPPTNICGARDTASFEVEGTDTSNGTIACTLNGQAIANNSMNTIYATNGSTTWANLTFNCTFNNQSQRYKSLTGLVNESFLSFNRSGWGTGQNISTQSDLDNYYAKQGIVYTNINSTTAMRLCAGENQTNRIAASGIGTNWTGYCYVITSLNIIPVPNQPGVKPTIIAPPFWRSQEMRNEQDEELIQYRYPLLALILIGGGVAFVGLLASKKRKPPLTPQAA